MNWRSRFPIRLAVFVAATHFLVYHAVMGAYLLVPRAHGAPDASPFWILFRLLSILSWPADILSPLVMRFGWMFPPFAAIPVAFASIVWSFGACAFWLVARRFVHRRLPEPLLHCLRSTAFIVACVLVSWLFFGPVSGFAGDLMFGILDAGRHMDGQFLFRPLWLIISGVLWALSVFGAYRFILISRHRVSPATA